MASVEVLVNMTATHHPSSKYRQKCRNVKLVFPNGAAVASFGMSDCSHITRDLMKRKKKSSLLESFIQPKLRDS